jgi:type IV fimbrial biogenesis protein FimT
MFGNCHRSRGFTLVELMITLLVVLILTLIAVPSFKDYIEKSRVRGTADQITDLLARARASAVKSNLPVAVRAQGASATWCLGAAMAATPASEWEMRPDTATPCDCDTNAAGCSVEAKPLVLLSADLSAGSPPEVTFTPTPTSGLTTGFSFSYTPKLGGVSSNGSPGKSFLDASVARSIAIKSPNGRYEVTINVSPLGQSHVCVPAGKPVFMGYRTCS